MLYSYDGSKKGMSSTYDEEGLWIIQQFSSKQEECPNVLYHILLLLWSSHIDAITPMSKNVLKRPFNSYFIFHVIVNEPFGDDRVNFKKS